MKFHEREFFIARIMSGRLKYKKNGLTLFINPSTVEQNYEAQEVFKSTYEKALSEGIMTEEECLLMLVEQGLWNDEDQESMDGLEKDIEQLKIEIYEAFFNDETRDAARDLLKKASKKLSELHERRHFYDFVNCQGVATYSRFYWIIENTTKHVDGSECNWEEISSQELLMHYQASLISEPQYRELARTEPWRTIWSTGKANGRLFDKSGIELTLEQRTLMAWSGLYDSVGESHESPPDKVIEDDDALDGWLLVQKRDRERDKAKSQAESKMSEKTANADEVYIFGNPKEVAALDTPESKFVRAQRMKQLEASEGEGIRHDRFEDMVQQRIIQQNQTI